MRSSKLRTIFVQGRKWFFTLALFVCVFALATMIRIKAAPLETTPPPTGGEFSVSGGELSGWIWGGSEEVSDGDVHNGLSGYETGVGWINVNCASKVDTGDPDDDPDALLKVCSSNSSINKNMNCNGPGAVSGCGTGSCIEACQNASYAVTVDAPDADQRQYLHGYGWSENLGWVKFDPDLSERPLNCGVGVDCPDFSARMVPTEGANVKRLEGWARINGIADDPSSGGWDGWIKLNGSLYNISVNVPNGTLSG
jgi:hypothetical protein